MAVSNQVDCNAQVPEVVVKNTFLDFDMPTTTSSTDNVSLSCPAEVFSPSQKRVDGGNLADSLAGIEDMKMCDLAAAAQMFSNGKISRADMESNGHVAHRAPQFKPPPPPLSAACFSEEVPLEAPEAPNWTPKVETNGNIPPPPPCMPKVENGDAIPEAPAWTPTIGSNPLQGPAPPPAPAPLIFPDASPAMAPPSAQPPAAPALPLAQAVPLTQEQLDSYSCSDQDSPTASVELPQQVWLYRVSFLGGIALRSCPNVEAPCTGHLLYHNEIFAVHERIQGADGRLYLLLADYRGWAFDDSALMPHDPSVVRGRWSPMDAGASHSSTAHMACDQKLIANEDEPAKRRRHRKRGGVKRNKRKMAQAAAEAVLLGKSGKAFEEGDDADTDAPSEEDGVAPLEADSSSCNDAEREGVELFKEEDFPRLGSPVRSKHAIR